MSNGRAAIVGVYNTRQGKRLDQTIRDLLRESFTGALADAGLQPSHVDGLCATGDNLDGRGELNLPKAMVYDFKLGPAWRGLQQDQALFEAVGAIEMGLADVVAIVSASSGAVTDTSSTAPWTRPENPYVAPFGLFTAAEFALMARRHMELYGTTPEQIAATAATIRNNGHVNPDAVFYGRGPYTVEDVLESRMIAEPFHLLDCSIVSEGGCGMIVASERVAAMVEREPAYLLGAGTDYLGPEYQFPPSWHYQGRDGTPPGGLVGARAADRAFANARLRREDVDVLELYDPFSFEALRQLEAFGFCPVGEGGRYVEDGNIAPDGPTPITTDGGLLSYGHAGAHAQILQRAIRAVEQVRGEAKTTQIADANVALFSAGGAGAMFTSVGLIGNKSTLAS